MLSGNLPCNKGLFPPVWICRCFGQEIIYSSYYDQKDMYYMLWQNFIETTKSQVDIWDFFVKFRLNVRNRNYECHGLNWFNIRVLLENMERYLKFPTQRKCLIRQILHTNNRLSLFFPTEILIIITDMIIKEIKPQLLSIT